jgi:hypothetical protein
MEKNHKVLNNIFEILSYYGCERKEVDGLAIVYSAKDSSYYWNYAYAESQIEDGQIDAVEKYFEEKDRKAAFYVIDDSKNTELISHLKKFRYTKHSCDSWLKFEKTGFDRKHFEQIVEVSNFEMLDAFIKTFDMSYRADDPQNPYGELGAYLDVARGAWSENHNGNKVRFFIAMKDKKPVAVASLNNCKGLGYISNVGSLKEVRGEGYGKAVTLFCVNESIKHGNDEHYIATERGTYPYDFYQRLGFAVKFEASYFLKDEK